MVSSRDRILNFLEKSDNKAMQAVAKRVKSPKSSSGSSGGSSGSEGMAPGVTYPSDNKKSSSGSSSGSEGMAPGVTYPSPSKPNKPASQKAPTPIKKGTVFKEYSIKVEWIDKTGKKHIVGTSSDRFVEMQQGIRDKGGYVSTVWRGSKVLAGGSGSQGMSKPDFGQFIETTKWDIPTVVKSTGLQSRYKELAWKVFIGELSSDRATKIFNKELTKAQTVEWMQKYGDFDGKTWKEIKAEEPAVYLQKTDKGFKTYIDVVRWEKETKPKVAPGGLASWDRTTWDIGKTFSKVMMPINEFTGWFFETQKYPRKDKIIAKKEAESHYAYSKAWNKGDVFTFAGRATTSPLGIIGISKLLGTGLGLLKSTEFGSKVLFQSAGTWSTTRTLPFTQIPLTTAGTPIYTVTTSGAVNTAITGYFTFETAKGLHEAQQSGNLKQALGNLAVTIPLAYMGYKSGYKAGLGYMQRTKAMSTLKGTARVQQQGFYNILDEIPNLKKPVPRTDIPFDLRTAQQINKYNMAGEISFYFRYERYKLIFGENPSIGGSLSTNMILGDWFRTGAMPKGLAEYALARQALSNAPTRGLIGKTPPVDVDLLITKNIGTAYRLYQPHIVDVSVSRPGEYHWGGMTTLKPIKGVKIVDPYLSNLNIKVLPQEQMIGAYGMTLPGKGKIYLSNDIVFSAKDFGYTKLTGYKWHTFSVKSKSVYIAESIGGIPKETSGYTVLLHEFMHNKYPPNQGVIRNLPGYTHLHEVKTELLEYPMFRDTQTKISINKWFKTGNWEYPTRTVKVNVMDPRDQFMRKTVSSMPSMKNKFYRSYKDVADFSDLYDYFYLSSGNRGLEIGMNKILHPEKYKIPKVTIGEKIVSKIKVVKPPAEPVSISKIKYSYNKTNKINTSVPISFGSYQATNNYKTSIHSIPIIKYDKGVSYKGAKTTFIKLPNYYKTFKGREKNTIPNYKINILNPYITGKYNNTSVAPPLSISKISIPQTPYTPPPPVIYKMHSVSKQKKKYFSDTPRIKKDYFIPKRIRVKYRYRQFELPNINKIMREAGL